MGIHHSALPRFSMRYFTAESAAVVIAFEGFPFIDGEPLEIMPVSVNVAHPLLQEIRNEMVKDGRLFTFLCGHDSNVGSILAALEAEEFELPNSIESKSPIGCKIVFTKWSDSEGKDYWGVDLVYLTPDQLRGMSLLGQGNSPAIFPISLDGLEQNEAGLYNETDLLGRFDQAIAAYDTMVEEYADNVLTEVPEPAVAQ